MDLDFTTDASQSKYLSKRGVYLLEVTEYNHWFRRSKFIFSFKNAPHVAFKYEIVYVGDLKIEPTKKQMYKIKYKQFQPGKSIWRISKLPPFLKKRVPGKIKSVSKRVKVKK